MSDALANLGSRMEGEFFMFEQLPAVLSQLFLFYYVGIVTPRLVLL